MPVIARLGQRHWLVPATKHYLERYGYKEPCKCPEKGLCHCCCEGIKKLQAVLHKVPIGKLDTDVMRIMRRPRCGNPDFPVSSGIMAKVSSGYKWQENILTWSMLGYTRDILGKQEVKAFKDALKAWETALEGKLKFKHFLVAKLKKAVEADIVAIFGLTTHKAPDPQKKMCPYDFSGELAHAFYPISHLSEYYYLAGNCHFDDTWDWVAKKAAGTSGTYPFSFTGVAVHEIGHALGLAHDTEHQDSLMFPFFTGKEELSVRDIKAIKEIYQ